MGKHIERDLHVQEAGHHVMAQEITDRGEFELGLHHKKRFTNAEAYKDHLNYLSEGSFDKTPTQNTLFNMKKPTVKLNDSGVDTDHLTRLVTGRIYRTDTSTKQRR